jgi:hypothetical protein
VQSQAPEPSSTAEPSRPNIRDRLLRACQVAGTATFPLFGRRILYVIPVGLLSLLVGLLFLLVVIALVWPRGGGSREAGSDASFADSASKAPSGPPLDLLGEMAAVDFPDDLTAQSLEQFVRFGTRARAAKSKGDQFDRLELERDRDLAAHRERLAGASWLVKDLGIQVPRREDFTTNGLFVTCTVPFHLDVPREEQWSCSVAHSRIYPNWANVMDVWFLAKDKRLYRCNPLAIEDVQRNGGVLYFPEAKVTSLILNVGVDLAAAKNITRQSHSYAVDLVVERLQYSQVRQWGYFRTDTLREEDLNSAAVVRRYDLGMGTGVAPTYFVVDERPWLVHGGLRSAVLKDHRGNPIASFKLK